MNKVNVVDRIVDQARNQAGLNVIKGKLSCRTADKKNGQSKGSRKNESLRDGFKRGKTGALIVDPENSSNRGEPENVFGRSWLGRDQSRLTGI